MKRILLVSFLLLSLALAGCSSPTAFFEGVKTAVSAATSTITNPVGDVELYQITVAYDAAGKTWVRWRRLCWEKPYRQLMASAATRFVCEKRRTIQAALLKADDRASAAITAAEKFVAANKNNPQISAAQAIAAAWRAVNDFKAAIPAT